MSRPFADNPVILSEVEQAALQAWVDAVRPRLALSDWEITVVRNRAQGSALASSYVRHQADVSHIAVGAEYAEWTSVELRQNLTHELLHCHFERVTALADRLDERAATVARDQLRTRDRTGIPINVFRCVGCRDFHIGHEAQP